MLCLSIVFGLFALLTFTRICVYVFGCVCAYRFVFLVLLLLLFPPSFVDRDAYGVESWFGPGDALGRREKIVCHVSEILSSLQTETDKKQTSPSAVSAESDAKVDTVDQKAEQHDGSDVTVTNDVVFRRTLNEPVMPVAKSSATTSSTTAARPLAIQQVKLGCKNRHKLRITTRQAQAALQNCANPQAAIQALIRSHMYDAQKKDRTIAVVDNDQDMQDQSSSSSASCSDSVSGHSSTASSPDRQHTDTVMASSQSPVSANTSADFYRGHSSASTLASQERYGSSSSSHRNTDLDDLTDLVMLASSNKNTQ
jgi:hypothetical protein